MTRSYDTGEDATNPAPFSVTSARCLEYAVTTDTNIWIYIGSGNEIYYCYGDDDSWTATAITGAGSPIGYDTAAIEHIALKYDPNNDVVHIAFSADDKIYHSVLNDPDNPVVAQFTTFVGSGLKYERVDNSANNKRSVSIAVDDSLQGQNGTDVAHVVWEEESGGTWYVRYNYADQGPGNDEFNSTFSIQIATGSYPTIMNIAEDGRQLHVYWINSGLVQGLRCINNVNPGVASNWTGPQSGTTAFDTVLTYNQWGDGIDSYSASYYWDQDEFVLVAGVDSSVVSGDVFTRYYIGTGANPTWMPQITVGGYTGHADACSLTNIPSPEFRLFILTSSNEIYHAVEDIVANNYNFSASSDWYKLSDTDVGTVAHLSAEWRAVEHNDLALTYRRSHILWKEDTTDNLWFSQARENTSPDSEGTSPSDGAKLRTDTGHDVLLDWDTSDNENDTQDDYKVQVDDNSDFSSPTIDTAWAGAGTSTTSHNITGGTLGPDTCWYWRRKLKDNEKGDEYDPYSEGEWSSFNYFYSTPQIDISLLGVAIQTDKDIYLPMRIICDLDTGETLLNGEFDDGAATVYAQYTTNDGSSWSTMTVKVAECTGASVTLIPTGRPPGAYYILAWDAGTDLGSTFAGYVRFRVRAQYDGDALGLGYCDWVEFPTQFELDYAAPVVTAVWPIDEDVGNPRPTLQATITDDNDWESQFQINDDPTFVDAAEYDSGYVEGAYTYTPTGDLAIGDWYWRVRAKDDFYPIYNVSNWDQTGSFTVRGGAFVATVLGDGTNNVSLRIISDMNINMNNVLIEYENIRNDFEETDVLQNIPEYRGHSPVEIDMDILFLSDGEDNTDIKRIHTWQRDETKLTLKAGDETILSLGNSISSYRVDKFKIVKLVPVYKAGTVKPFTYSMTLREVQP